jgi:hypothetical protein
MKKRFAIVTALLALLVCVATASAAGGLSGTFKTKIGGSSGLAGTWTIKFSHGNYKVTDNGSVMVKGKYTTSGSRLTMTDTGGRAACKPTGKYAYKISGKTLKLKNTGDKSPACLGRAVVLSHTFTKV